MKERYYIASVSPSDSKVFYFDARTNVMIHQLQDYFVSVAKLNILSLVLEIKASEATPAMYCTMLEATEAYSNAIVMDSGCLRTAVLVSCRSLILLSRKNTSIHNVYLLFILLCAVISGSTS